MAYYGVVFPEFWTGRTGRELRSRGKEAQLLALYLATNRHTNMIGLYRLHLDDVRHETGLQAKGLERGFLAVHETDFATFDSESAFVWVKSLARVRLGMKVGTRLDPDDKRTMAVNRIYHAIEANPFLGAFFDVNAGLLRLKKRREGFGVVVPFAATTTGRAYLGATKPLISQITESGSDQNDQRTDKSSAAVASHSLRSADEDPADNVGVITKIAHEAIGRLGPDDPDLHETIKSLCAKRHIAYNSAIVGAALDSARVQHARRPQ